MTQRIQTVVIAWLLVSVVVCVGFLALVTSIDTRVLRIPVSDADRHLYPGLYAREADHRWSSNAQQLRIPTVRDVPHIVTLALSNGYPSDLAPPVVTVPAGHHGSASWPVPAGAVRRYQILTTAHGQWRWDRTVDLSSTVERIGADGRGLGVVFAGVTVAPTHTNTLAGYDYALGLALALATILFVLLTLCGALWRWATGMSVAFAAVPLGCLLADPVATWPYLWWFVAGAGIAVLVVAVAALSGLVDRRLQVRGADLPVWFALAWWAIPFVQQVLIADNVYIRAYDYDSWMGWLGAIALGGSIAVRWSLRHDAALDRYLRWLPLIVMVLMSLVFQSTVFMRMFRYGSGDFSIWVDAATRWVTTGTLYLVSNVADNPFAGYKRPPFYIMLFTPFVGQDPLDILNGFRVINIALFVATAAVWLRSRAPHRLWWWLAVVLILANMQPLYETVTFGQTDVILLFCMMLILWALQKERAGWAGVIVALLTSLKIYPILFLAFFVIKQRWWGVVGFVVGMLAWNGIAVLVMGWDLHWMYLTKVVGHVGGTTAWIENQTIAGFLTRFYDNPFVMNRFGVPEIARIASLLSMAVSAMVCLLALRDAPSTSSTYALQYGLFVMLMVLAIPVAWMHYYTLMVLVFWIVVWHHSESVLTLRRAAAYAVSFAFIAYGNFRSFNYPEDYGAVTLLLGSYKLYAILLLLVLLTTEIIRHRSTWAAPWLALWRRLQPAK